MNEKLQPLTILRAYVTPESIKEGKPIYLMEKEFQQWVILHANFFLERYEQQHPEMHWTQNQRKNIRLGLCGQKATEMVFQQIEVAYVPNDPIIDQRFQKPYDFLIPQLGTIEVKTVEWYAQKVLVKAKEWHGNDFLVIWKIDEEEKKLALIGYLRKQEVESYPITPKKESKYTKYASARVIDLSDLNNSETFLTKLREAKMKIFNMV